jgi:tRNA (guanine26-N2/guanine27-N2)-dimethyltransferase
VSLEALREGDVEFFAEPARTSVGPASREAAVFYNPAMRHSRDVSVCLCGAIGFGAGKRMLDGMAASGVRGLRLAMEACPRAEVTINDRDGLAFEAIRKGIECTAAGNATAANEDLRALLVRGRYDYVDVDPFGSPVPFVDSAVRACRRGAVLAVTATDTAALCGTLPRTCERRYMARSLLNECAHELGARILAGFVVRSGAVHDIAARPILCYARGHYMRTYFSVRPGAVRADALLKDIGYANFDGDGARWTSRIPEAELWAGPLWADECFDAKTLDAMLGYEEGSELGLEKDLRLWRAEIGGPAYHHDVAWLSRHFKTSQPRMERLLAGLKEGGFFAGRTSFAPTGFRTDAPVEEIRRLF